MTWIWEACWMSLIPARASSEGMRLVILLNKEGWLDRFKYVCNLDYSLFAMKSAKGPRERDDISPEALLVNQGLELGFIASKELDDAWMERVCQRLCFRRIECRPLVDQPVPRQVADVLDAFELWLVRRRDRGSHNII